MSTDKRVHCPYFINTSAKSLTEKPLVTFKYLPTSHWYQVSMCLFWSISRISANLMVSPLEVRKLDTVIKLCPIYFFLFSLVLLVSYLSIIAKFKLIKIYAYVFFFFPKSLIVLVQTFRSLIHFSVSFCVWCEVGVQRHYLWIQKIPGF